MFDFKGPKFGAEKALEAIYNDKDEVIGTQQIVRNGQPMFNAVVYRVRRDGKPLIGHDLLTYGAAMDAAYGMSFSYGNFWHNKLPPFEQRNAWSKFIPFGGGWVEQRAPIYA